MTMTSASLAALMASPKLFREWAPRVTTRKYDQAQKPPVEKAGLTLGMGMTEKQGGTDVRANTTRAERAGDGFYRLTGHKWFMSAPMSDAFLVLAQAERGAVVLPGAAPDRRGRGNGLRFQRLKDKLGNRSNASSEVEFAGAIGEMVGEPGAGIKTIMDMVTLTRLDCAVASAGAHARRACRGRPSHPPPPGLRQAADRPAADAARAGRHGARRAGGDRAVVPAGALVRRGGERPRRGGLRPRHDAGRQILGLQDRAVGALRGDGVPRRQWLCRGERRCPLLSRGAGQRDLGRLGQRHGARRAARAGAGAEPVRRGAGRHRAGSRPGRPGTTERAAGRPCRSPARTRARRAS